MERLEAAHLVGYMRQVVEREFTGIAEHGQSDSLSDTAHHLVTIFDRIEDSLLDRYFFEREDGSHPFIKEN